jgi:hypothetical protein
MVPMNAENGNFAKVTYVNEGYKDGIRYKDSQPLENRKKGFGTHDATKRDEFSNVIATEQYRETLRKEKLLSSETPEQINLKLTKMLGERAANDTLLASQGFTKSMSNMTMNYRTQKIHQYDIGMIVGCS